MRDSSDMVDIVPPISSAVSLSIMLNWLGVNTYGASFGKLRKVSAPGEVWNI